MRVIGFILVMLGGMVLGYQGLNGSFEPNGIRQESEGQSAGGISSVPPVISGIVVVSGLLLLASGRRSED